MFDVGGPEFLFLILLALLVFGPRRLPSIGRELGGHAARLRRSWFELRRELEREVGAQELDGVRDAARRIEGEVRRFKEDLVEPRSPAPAPAEGGGQRDRAPEAGDPPGDGAAP
ncbi:MAG: twin-arginine translocase TatA/TatE family subunit [Acidobacteriota bacterium]|nr:twin-arginine translocase TatA/TatE family subunit [Acidobacteriota bacterium]